MEEPEDIVDRLRENADLDAMEHVPADIVQMQRDAVDEILRLRKALEISTNGLRHCARWNISEEKEKTLMSVVMENEAILKTPQRRVERPEAACGRRVALERRVRAHG